VSEVLGAEDFSLPAKKEKNDHVVSIETGSPKDELQSAYCQQNRTIASASEKYRLLPISSADLVSYHSHSEEFYRIEALPHLYALRVTEGATRSFEQENRTR
jgi:hypothetical protein